MTDLERGIGGRFDLPSLEMEPLTAPTASAAPVSTTPASDPAGAPAVPVIDPTDARLRLADRLELAAACLRRNDTVLARRLLEDVVHDGDSTQREAARSLLRQLG